MGKYLLIRALLHLFFFLVAGVSGLLGVFLVGVSMSGDNSGALFGGAPFFFGTYFMLLFVEFYWRYRHRLLNLKHWKSARAWAWMAGVFFGEGFSAFFALCSAMMLEFYSLFHISAQAHPGAVGSVFLSLFLAIDAFGGAVLYQISGAKKAPASEEPSA